MVKQVLTVNIKIITQYNFTLTEADKKNDMKSPKRKLDRKLVLIVQEMINGKEIWKLPDGYYNNEETLKEVRIP